MTTLKQCVAAWKALDAISTQPMDYKSAHALVVLKARMRPHVLYFSRTEMELVEKYASHDNDGDVIYEEPGRISFKTADDMNSFARERAQLDEVELGEEIPRAKIAPPAQITLAQLEALEPYIDVEGANV